MHRYGAHRMFTMSRFWDRFFYVSAFVAQGPSFLIPRAYAFLHREHHAFADSERDPHSPLTTATSSTMMWTDQDSATTPTPTAAPSPSRASTAARPSGRRSIGLADAGRAPRLRRALLPLLRRVRAVADLVRALADPLADGPDPRRDRQLVRPQVRLSQLRHARRSPQHAAVRLPDDGRAVPEQPSPATAPARTSPRAGSRSIPATR